MELIDELQNDRPTGRPRLSLATVEPKALPARRGSRWSGMCIRRRLSCRSIAHPYLVMVAPHGPDGLPDVAGLRAFRVPGDTGINYRADTWHHPLSALERAGRFVVLTFVDGHRRRRAVRAAAGRP